MFVCYPWRRYVRGTVGAGLKGSFIAGLLELLLGLPSVSDPCYGSYYRSGVGARVYTIFGGPHGPAGEVNDDSAETRPAKGAVREETCLTRLAQKWSYQ